MTADETVLAGVRRWVVPNGFAGGPEGDATTAVMVRLDDLRAALRGAGLPERRGLGTLITALLDEHWPNSGVNGWYLADLIRGAGLPEPNGHFCTELCDAKEATP